MALVESYVLHGEKRMRVEMRSSVLMELTLSI